MFTSFCLSTSVASCIKERHTPGDHFYAKSRRTAVSTLSLGVQLSRVPEIGTEMKTPLVKNTRLLKKTSFFHEIYCFLLFGGWCLVSSWSVHWMRPVQKVNQTACDGQLLQTDLGHTERSVIGIPKGVLLLRLAERSVILHQSWNRQRLGGALG